MKDSVWLGVGVACTAAAIGYMVGASNSPVVGSVVPAAFGLLTIAFAVPRRVAPSEKPDGATPEALAALGPRSVGILLTVFATAYLGSALTGSAVRTWPARPIHTPFPWTNSTAPADHIGAIQWLVVQKRLLAYGYTPDQIQELYTKIPPRVSNSSDFSPKEADPGLLDAAPEPGTTVSPKTTKLIPGTLTFQSSYQSPVAAIESRPPTH